MHENRSRLFCESSWCHSSALNSPAKHCKQNSRSPKIPHPGSSSLSCFYSQCTPILKSMCRTQGFHYNLGICLELKLHLKVLWRKHEVHLADTWPRVGSPFHWVYMLCFLPITGFSAFAKQLTTRCLGRMGAAACRKHSSNKNCWAGDEMSRKDGQRAAHPTEYARRVTGKTEVSGQYQEHNYLNHLN